MEPHIDQQDSHPDTQANQPTPPVAPNDNPLESPSSNAYPQPAPLQQAGYSQPAAPAVPAPVVAVNPAMIVLQWLTYAFWGWTIFAVSILTATILANIIGDNDTGGFTPYAIAAVLVLLPISIACDYFYTKHEPQKKTGAASIVMVIHAVLFALFGIGALIAIVISLVTMFTSSGDSTTSQISLLSALIITILYAAVFLRTINPLRFRFMTRFYIVFMTIVVGVVSAAGIIGPVAHEHTIRNDKLIESNLSSVKSGIDGYAHQNKKLPENLSMVELSDDAKVLVDKNLVKYSPNTRSSTSLSNYEPNKGLNLNQTTTYYYQLCVQYTHASKNKYGSSVYQNQTDSDGYDAYLASYNNHPAGEKCYKLKTDNYSY